MPLIIKSLSTNAGFLENAELKFSEKLTCIIGARGTCKSTTIETLRFLFNAGSSVEVKQLIDTPSTGTSDVPSRRGLIRATLAGGTAKCELESDSMTWVVERDLDSSPRLFAEGVRELEEVSLLENIEIYSQGDLKRIAESSERRLALIDAPAREEVEGLRAERSTVAGQLAKLGPQIRNLRLELESRRAELKSLPAQKQLLEELVAAKPTASVELEKERTRFLERRAIFETLKASTELVDSTLESLLKTLHDLRGALAPVKALEEIQIPEVESLLEFFNAAEAVGNEIESNALELKSMNAGDLLAAARAKFAADSQNYYKLLKEQQDFNEILKKEDQHKAHIKQLELVQAEYDRKSNENRALLTERLKLRNSFNELSDRIFDLRLAQVQEINSHHGEKVLLALRQGLHSEIYATKLQDILRTSNLRNQADVAKDIASFVRPQELIDLVERSDSTYLSRLVERDLGQMTRLVSFLLDRPELYDLENVIFEDELEITMFDDGVPKPLAQLSEGQMATALLPLILRPAPYPLLFDQPEDDLDNRFIYETLVKHISELKHKRQLIFITHNANIPVLGDAECVIVMSMAEPKKADKPSIGTVEQSKASILSLLEGGADAFQRRSDRYGSLLAPVKK